MAMASSLRIRPLGRSQTDKTHVSSAMNGPKRHKRNHGIQSNRKGKYDDRHARNKANRHMRSGAHVSHARPASTQGGQSRLHDKSEHSTNRRTWFDDDDLYDDDFFEWFDDDWNDDDFFELFDDIF